MKKRVRGEKSFRWAVMISLIAHFVLFLLILTAPSLPKSSQKGMIHYVNLVSLPRGSGGDASTPAGRETIRDLAVAQQLKQQEESSSLRHPVDTPEKDEKAEKDKKTAISQSEKSLTDLGEGGTKEGNLTSRSGPSPGTGLRIGGLGETSETGEDLTSQIGISRFPYTYYLQLIMDRASANWFTSLVDPGLSGTYHASVYFKIARNGEVLDLQVDKPSGIRSLDLSAMRAIKSSSPFPPLPKDYGEEYLIIRLIFEYSK